MAYISVNVKSTTDATIRVNGLQYPANQYSNFEFVVTVTDNGALVNDYNTSFGGTGYYCEVNYTGWFNANWTYSVVVYATYNGVQYTIPSTNFTMDSASSYLEVVDIGTTTATLRFKNLSFPLNEYSNFQFKCYLNGYLAVDYNTTFSSSTASGWGIAFSNPDYLGFNWFTPNSTYTYTLVATYNGNQYTIPSIQFTTNSISPPSGSINPIYYTTIRDQFSSPNCTATSLACAMDRIRAKACGDTYENYSASYIFGAGNSSTGMNSLNAIQKCQNNGSPRWELVNINLTTDDAMEYNDAHNLYLNAPSYAKDNAMHQRFTGYSNIDFYDTLSVQNAVENYGCFSLGISVPYNFFNVGTNGIIPQPDSDSGNNHNLQIIGLTSVNNKPHWIVQNSWGTSWGANGLGYLPYDWGCGANPPTCQTNTCSSWTNACYSIYNSNSPSNIYSAPTNVKATNPSNKNLHITWNTSLSGATYEVLISPNNYYWYEHGRTTNNYVDTTVSTDGTFYIIVLSSINNVYSKYSTKITVTVGHHRPDSFYWDTVKLSGNDFDIQATEWNRLIKNIKDIYIYKGIQSYTPTMYDAIPGYNFTAINDFNRVKNAIGYFYNNANPAAGINISDKSQGNTIYASYFSGDYSIQKKLNDIT